jgi:hypothetical protein
VTGNKTGLQTNLRQLVALNRPLIAVLDAVGLRDCGSKQN